MREVRWAGGQPPTLLPPRVQGNACKGRLCGAASRANLFPSTQGGADRWLKPHRSTEPKHSLTAGPCSNSLHPTVGGSFSRAWRTAVLAASHPVRLTDRHSICTAAGALRRISVHTWNAWPQAPTPAASSAHPTLRRDDTTTPGAPLGGLVCQGEGAGGAAGANRTFRLWLQADGLV
jgi:hypothetical protein